MDIHSGPVRFRVAGADDLPVLRDIEVAAGQCFRDIGMAPIAEDEPPPLDALEGYRSAGRAWVAVDTDDDPVAYLVSDLVDGDPHVEQVSVHPRAARQGIGRALIDHLAEHSGGAAALTLSTFESVPWNAPYYVRCGFRVLADAELTPGLRRLRRAEAAKGLDRWPRVCMRRDL